MEKNLTTGSVFGNVVRFSLPYLFSYFLQTLYGMADLFIIGQYADASGTTAVSVGSQVMHMLTVMIVGLAMGATVTIGQAQLAINICAFLRQSCRRQRLHAPKQLDRKAQRGMNRRQHAADSAREQQRSHRQRHRQKQPAHPFALRRIRQVLPQKCFQCADGFSHDDNGMHQPRRVAEYPIQYKAAKHRHDDSHAFSSA